MCNVCREALNYSEIEEEEGEEYIVEKILDKRIEERKTVYYLIKWKGYGDEDNTWEPKLNLGSEMIKEYENRQIQNQANEKQGKNMNQTNSTRLTIFSP